MIGNLLREERPSAPFLADTKDFAAMNAVYATYFPRDPPACSTVAASGLALGARVEIECIATAG